MARSVVISICVVAVLIGAFARACHVPEERIRTSSWKYNDDEVRGGFPHSDFLHFEGSSSLLLKNDTIYRADTVLGAVHCALRKLDGRDRLFIKLLPSGRTFEYIRI